MANDVQYGYNHDAECRDCPHPYDSHRMQHGWKCGVSYCDCQMFRPAAKLVPAVPADTRMVIVHWVDSACFEDEQFDMDDDHLNVMPAVSVGHVVKETNTFLAIAQDRFTGYTKPYRNVLVIPKRAIDKITRVDPNL